MQYTDLFVDFDDTIYDTHGNAVLALEELYRDFHLDRHFACIDDFTVPYWRENINLWRQYSQGQIDRDYLMVERFRRPLAEGEGLDPDREFCLRVSDHFLDLCSVKPGILPGARELLDYLQGRGYRMHLCSNGFHEVQYKKLNASDTMRYFTTVVLSEDAGANKPSKAFFDYALRVSEADPARTLMIGDNPDTDITGAHTAGLDTLYYNRWDTPAHPTATMQVSSLTEIIGLL